MRQIVPHRNNIGSVGRSCKTFLRPVRHLSVNWLAVEKRFELNVTRKSSINSVRPMS